jgi:acyl-coenzyme A synthetase/AMP-(fatty) acid ligase
VPRRVLLVDALPTNASGKVVNYQLREWVEEVVRERAALLGEA